ncbi:hypothetical protein PCC7418_0385 [Halothece sp. PCC 7418]|uniref:hypothetical protein n=1 Tax=Halothece sp. (strain PCC 7418) TaxID=65093 RepID=UPI0002A06DB6|nr:hypothetical protein [Halothece sp. PCC 7418]AFZ42619.1 hypothetical protein PCC7418_0385 [Halothece sp. PCC 7418]
MSEADTPKSSPFSDNDYDAIEELIASEDNDESDELDELLASLEPSPSTEENNDNESSLDESLFWEADTEATEETPVVTQLQERNHQLLRRNAELQRALETAQTELEQQQFRLRQAEDLNAQQNDEINAASEQNLSLSQELKNYRLQEQQQAEKITQLTHQLKVSQQRVAQLERECALIQKQFQEQSYKLCQAEKYSRDLSFRLQQQRRHTWQFKSALNKCLETTAEKTDQELMPNPPVSSQPIPPWSSQQSHVSVNPDQPAVAEVSFEEEPDSILEITGLSEGESKMPSEGEPSDATMAAESSQNGVKTTPSLPHRESSSRFSPSPLVSSNRKKRQSYAAVELPKFVR